MSLSSFLLPNCDTGGGLAVLLGKLEPDLISAHRLMEFDILSTE